MRHTSINKKPANEGRCILELRTRGVMCTWATFARRLTWAWARSAVSEFWTWTNCGRGRVMEVAEFRRG